MDADARRWQLSRSFSPRSGHEIHEEEPRAASRLASLLTGVGDVRQQFLFADTAKRRFGDDPALAIQANTRGDVPANCGQLMAERGITALDETFAPAHRELGLALRVGELRATGLDMEEANPLSEALEHVAGLP